MAKKHHSNYRAEQNRKRNLEQAEIRRKQAKNKAIWEAHHKQIIIGAVAVVVALVLIWLGSQWFGGMDGSLPNFFGNLRTVESDWLVTNVGSTSKPKYFKMGEMSAPEGYTLDPEYLVTTDSKNQTFYYAADDENAAVKSVYVAGVANTSAEAMLETVLGYESYYQFASEPIHTTIAGHDVHYAYLVYSDSSTATDTDLDGEMEVIDGYPSLCLYVDSVADSCVLVLMNGHTAALADVATQEEMEPMLEKILPLLTVEK